MRAKYVYGVVASTGRAPRDRGIGGAPLTLVRGDGVAALVSDVAGSPVLDREAISAHERVLERAMTSGTVLPMRFGIVMDGESDVRDELLNAHGERLRAQLLELAGAVQLQVRAVYEEQTVLREVLSDDPELRALRDSIQGLAEAATRHARIRLGELVAAALDHKRSVDAEAILAALTPLSQRVSASQPEHERIVMHASFLVAREGVSRFDAALEEIGRSQVGRIRLKLTGPLPPHSFVSLES